MSITAELLLVLFTLSLGCAGVYRLAPLPDMLVCRRQRQWSLLAWSSLLLAFVAAHG